MSQCDNADDTRDYQIASQDNHTTNSMTPAVGQDDILARARAALGESRWAEALDILAEAGSEAGSAAGLEIRAQAAYGAGDPEASVGAWEDLHTLHLRTGDKVAAAKAAAFVAMYLMIDSGLMSPIRGWLRRAERLLEGIGETPVHAVVAMVRTYERLWCGDMEGAGTNASQAITLGRRHDFPTGVLIGQIAEARLRIFEGNTDEGIELLDDIAITLMSGEVDAMTAGMAYCELICAMQGLTLYERAGEWTKAMEKWRHGTAFGGFNGRCRVHRAEMLRLSGPCGLAEEVALEACEELRPWMRREFGWPLTELGNIRLRKGDLPGAEEAFLAAHENAWTPQPGLALLRLAQGDVTSAYALITDALDNPVDVPSKERPPHGGLRRAPLLDAQVEIALAAGDQAGASKAAAELCSIAEGFKSQALVAMAALANGRMALAVGDTRAAIRECERAVATWVAVGAPFEASVARMTLGEAHQVSGNTEGAQMDWSAAGKTFTEFGALLWARRASEMATVKKPMAAAPAVQAEDSNIFRCEGEMRRVCFDGVTVLLHDLKGFRYLERLLAEPNREFHVLDLVAVERGSLPTVPAAGEFHTLHPDAGHAGLMLDKQARDAYKRRLVDIDDDIEDAERMNDLDRLALAKSDRDYLVQELSRAIGLGGRPRLAVATSERARTSVARSLRYALKRLGEHHHGLGPHLDQAIGTGTYCRYTPDPRLPVKWSV